MTHSGVQSVALTKLHLGFLGKVRLGNRDNTFKNNLRMPELSKNRGSETVPKTIKFFETLLRASLDGIIITNAMQDIIVVNEAFCAVLGRKWREVMETSIFLWLEQLDGDAVQRWVKLEQLVRTDGNCRNLEFQITQDGQTKFFSVGL